MSEQRVSYLEWLSLVMVYGKVDDPPPRFNGAKNNCNLYDLMSTDKYGMRGNVRTAELLPYSVKNSC